MPLNGTIVCVWWIRAPVLTVWESLSHINTTSYLCFDLDFDCVWFRIVWWLSPISISGQAVFIKSNQLMLLSHVGNNGTRDFVISLVSSSSKLRIVYKSRLLDVNICVLTHWLVVMFTNISWSVYVHTPIKMYNWQLSVWVFVHWEQCHHMCLKDKLYVCSLQVCKF